MGRRIDRRFSFLVCSRLGKPKLFVQILFLLVALCLFISLASQLATSNTMTQNDLRFQAQDMGRNTDAVQNVSSIRGQPPPRRESPGACNCGSDPTDLWDSLEYSAMRRRRKELEEWERLHDHEIEPLVECRTSSPLRYPASGITVEPFDTVKLRRLRLDPDHPTVKGSDSFTLTFVSEKSLGILFVSNSTFLKGVDVSGNFTGNVKIQSKAVTPIQQVCQSVYYHSNLYDIDTRDRITVTLNNVSFTINVRIKRRPMPFLYDPGESHHVNDLVTVITKTFERYDAVNRLIKSVNKRYPGMTTIVADDSERPQRLSGKHVKHYTMPFAEGASAGRNLALSQVEVK
ncbi:beta-1,4 N-acetylgalactosaminyltransferase 1-like [Ptychodera flava]|uniref:beta-1,4 N-acetylgalactosaminyltransferase 1-like n=1 Tax=Ptychodera flava TaxID=63121 RepID=UPI003969FD12